MNNLPSGKIKALSIIFITVITVILKASWASAQESLSTTATPPRLEVEALPGATVQETLKVRNESATDMAYSVDVADFIVNNSQGTPIPVDETVSGRWSLTSWVTVSPKQILIKAGQAATVDLIVNVPLNALAGGHYAMITYSPVKEGKMAGTGAEITPKVGTLIYLKVIGDVTEAANLKEFRVKNNFSHYGPIELMAEIENLGDIHIRPAGKITVSNWLNDPIFSRDLEEKNIFPFASRTYEWQVPGKWRLGRYAAKIEALAGDSRIPLSGLVYFWIVPVKELSIAAAALALILILVILKKRRPQNLEAVEPEKPAL